MNWLLQSPNIDPIELLWDELDRQIRKMAIIKVRKRFRTILKSKHFAKQWSKYEVVILMMILFGYFFYKDRHQLPLY